MNFINKKKKILKIVYYYFTNNQNEQRKANNLLLLRRHVMFLMKEMYDDDDVYNNEKIIDRQKWKRTIHFFATKQFVHSLCEFILNGFWISSNLLFGSRIETTLTQQQTNEKPFYHNSENILSST